MYRQKFLGGLLLSLLTGAVAATAVAQMGNPGQDRSKVPNQDLDPTRHVQSRLESTIHTPLAAQYIWAKDSASTQGADLTPHYFRRSFSFTATDLPEADTLYIAGPRSATIYLNGEKVCSYALNLDFRISIRVHACDVTHALRPGGTNVLAIEAVRGPSRGAASNDPIGLQFTHGEVMAVKIVPASRGVVAPPLVISDAQWKAALQAPDGWQSTSFDDSSWKPANDLGGIESNIELFQWNADAGLYAWPGYDGISPFLAQYSLAPAKVTNVFPGAGQLSNVDSLTNSSGADFTVTLPTDSVTAYNAPQILLDFGREVVGRIELQSDSNQPADITVQYGESKAEAMDGPYLGVDPLHIPPHATAYGPKSAFRFALIRFTGGKDTHYSHIQLDGIEYPVTYKGSFSSSDPMLNQMWTIGAYTAHLCMQDDIWDAPKRDRGRWMGDLDVSGRTIEDAFGGNFLMDDTLNHLLGESPIHEDVNGIPGYSAFWVTGETEYYKHTGSMQQLQSVHTRLVQLLDYMETELDQRNLFADTNHAWPFVDWSPELNGDGPETRRATQMEFYAAFNDGAWLLRQLDDAANAEKFQQEAATLKAAAQQHLLDPSGSFGTRWQTNAYAVLSGVANPSQYPAIWKNSLHDVGHVKYNALIITPYYNYYVVSAMAKMGHRADALNWIRQFWGGMVDEGATSFWEGYDPSWYKGGDFHASLQADNMSGYTVSLAHGWSSGVTPWLMEQILGIHAEAAGFSQVSIRPDLIDLQWAKGAEPTPHGLLGVSIRKQGPGDLVSIDLPEGVHARVSVPVTGSHAQVLVNGKPEHSTPAENGKRAVVELSQAGHYELTSH